MMTEAELHEAACDYIRLTHPTVIFWSDGSGNNLSPIQAARNTALRSSKGVPDLHILVKRGNYGGMFAELKTLKGSPYLKNGKLSTDPHIQDQAEMLQALMYAGYYANFCVGIDDFVKQFDWYMAQ